MEKNIVVLLESQIGSKRLTLSVPEGATFFDVVQMMEREQQEADQKIFGVIVLARVENKLYELAQKVPPETEEIRLIDTTDMDGYRVYMRTLSFVFLEAVERLLPGTRTVVEHSISGGLYCVIRRDGRPLTIDTRTRDRLRQEMRKLIQADLPIVRERMSFEKAAELFAARQDQGKVDLFRQQTEGFVSVYRMGEAIDTFYGYMAPSTGCLTLFDLELFDHGLVLLGLDRQVPREVNNFLPTYLLSDTYNEAEEWSEMQGIHTVAQVNESILNGSIGEVCRMSEALMDHKIMRIAESIANQKKQIVLIAAPSSSGKTSFAYKLLTSLRVLGKRPIALSLDDYFVDREKTPLGPDGKPDFEALKAVDLKRFNADLLHLLRGEMIGRVRFDFKQGIRVLPDEKLALDRESPVIIEGIHGLNPGLTAEINDAVKYRIALSVITQINLDDHNRIPTTDLRLMRRMARDKQFRGRDVRETIRSWPSVRRGEDLNIFPYSENADVMFNSTSVYEISALKAIIWDDLLAIRPDQEEFVEAGRLIALLSYFLPMEDTSDVVNTSILREFIGGSRIVQE